MEEHPRLILRNFLSLQLCKELEFIHKSCSTVGYRPNVFSTTLSHLIATNSPHLILPFVSVREMLKEKVEEFFGCEYELFVEFTGLISWTKGASIGWHSDDNRPYLKQRDFATVCYLNSHGEDFLGGYFHFQDGEPTTVVPMAGDVLLYTADSRNIHSVDEITDGERLTLTLWFSRDNSHDEDAKLISMLSQNTLDSYFTKPASYLPFPASSNMYWFSPGQAPHDQSGFDIRYARAHILGLDFYASHDASHISATESSDLAELLLEPLSIARGNELFNKEFVNILHALQVVQFCCWKASELQNSGLCETGKIIQLTKSQRQKIENLKRILLKDEHKADEVFSYVANDGKPQHSFDWKALCAAIAAWEDYSGKLQNELLLCLPYWKMHKSIFSVPFDKR